MAIDGDRQLAGREADADIGLLLREAIIIVKLRVEFQRHQALVAIDVSFAAIVGVPETTCLRQERLEREPAGIAPADTAAAQACLFQRRQRLRQLLQVLGAAFIPASASTPGR